jgi:hypothetical protein
MTEGEMRSLGMTEGEMRSLGTTEAVLRTYQPFYIHSKVQCGGAAIHAIFALSHRGPGSSAGRATDF